MTASPKQVLRGIATAAVMVAWALAAHLGSAGQGHPDLTAALGVAPIVAALAMLLWRVRHPLWVAGSGLALLAALAWLWPALRQNVALLFFIQHLGINLALAALFGRTLSGPGEPLATRLARIVHNGVLSERQLRYTRQVTRAWTLFFLANAAVSALLYALAPVALWSFYANILTGPLVGLMFVAEHLLRMRVLPPEERPSIAEVVRVWRLNASARGS
jgi:uncharacterized membrane protein